MDFELIFPPSETKRKMVLEKVKKKLDIFLSCLKSKTDDINEEQNIKERDSTRFDEKEKDDFFMKKSDKLLVTADSNMCNVETSLTNFKLTFSVNNETEYVVQKSTKVSKNDLEYSFKGQGDGGSNEGSSNQTCYESDSVKVLCTCDHHNKESTVCESALVKCTEDDKSSGYNSMLICSSNKSANSNDLCSYKDKETCYPRSLVPSESVDCSDSLKISSLLQSNIHVESNEHVEQEHYMVSSLRKGSMSNESEVSCIESPNLKCVDRDQDPRTAGTTMWLSQSQVMTDNSTSISSDLHDTSLESMPSSDGKSSQNDFQDLHMDMMEEESCSIPRFASFPDLSPQFLSSFKSMYQYPHLFPLGSLLSLNLLPSFGTSDGAVSSQSSYVDSTNSRHFHNFSKSGSQKYICPRSRQLTPLPLNTVELHREKCASEVFIAENFTNGEYRTQEGEEKGAFSFETLINCASPVYNVKNTHPLAKDSTTRCEENGRAQMGSLNSSTVHKTSQQLWEKPEERDNLHVSYEASIDENLKEKFKTEFNVVNDQEENQLSEGEDGCGNKLSEQSLPQVHDHMGCHILKMSPEEYKIPEGSEITDERNKDLGQKCIFILGRHSQEMYYSEEIFEKEQFAEMEVINCKNYTPTSVLSIEDKIRSIEIAELEIGHSKDTRKTCNLVMRERNSLATMYGQLFMLMINELLHCGMVHQLLHENWKEKCYKENAKIHFTGWKEEQEHYFDMRETMWINFLHDISSGSSLGTCEFQILLQRLCPWLIPRTPPKYELGLHKGKEIVTCNSYPTSNRVPLRVDKNNEGSHCRKGDFSDECISMAVNTVCRTPETRNNLLTTNKSGISTDVDIRPKAKKSDLVNLSSHETKRGSQGKHNGQAPHKHSIRRRNKGRSCSLVPGKSSFVSTTRTRSFNSSKKNRKRKCHKLVKDKVSQHCAAGQNENVPNSVNTIMADFNDRNSPVCSIRRLSFSSLPLKSGPKDNLTLLVSLQNSTSQSRWQVQRKPLKYQHDLSAEKSHLIKKHLIRFFQRYEATKHRYSMSQVSMEKLENMSLPEMLYKIQSIPKGLSFLREHLKISKNYQLVSIDVRPLQQQPNQPQRAEETNYQPLQQQQTVQGTDIQPIQQANEPHAADVTDLENFLRQVINGDEEAIESRMRIEWFRIITFQTYPANVGISTIKLANNGFYYTGHTIETRCYFCRQTYNEWSAESNIEAVHRQLSPDCPFINGRPTNNVPIHGGRNDPSVQDSRAAIEHLRNPNLTSPNTVALPQDQARQSPPPSTSLGASADSASVDQGSEQEPVSGQPPSKSKLKRDKKKKKKEEQAKAKAAASASQGAVQDVPHTEEEVVSSLQSEPSITSSSSSEPTSAPGLAGGEIQPQSRALEPSPVGGAQATSVSIAVSVQPASTQSRQSSQTTSAQNTTNTSSSASSSATRQGGANPPGPPHGGANPPGPPQSGANPPAPTSAERLAQLDPLGINFDKPKYPAYAVYSTRLSSFDGWPSHMAQTPREMARAGYFYAGYGDYARCFFCGGGLRNWDRTDEPWMEHARWFPRCAFLRNNKGDKYVARVQRRHQEQEAGLQPSSQLPPPVERDEETAIAQALREMGYNNQIIQRAMNNWRRNLKPGRRHPPPMTASAILDIIEILESGDQENTERAGETPLTITGIDPSAGEVNRENSGNVTESMTSLGASALEENRTDARLDNQPREYGYDQREKQEKQVLQEDFLGLTETIVCKVCCDKDVAAAFLPCGHLVCCLDCAPAMRRCPLCAELIKGTVKTYFA